MASIVGGGRAVQCDVCVVICAAEVRVLMLIEASPLNGGRSR